jgi:hypothetical protein
MALPIGATPVLRGKEAANFIVNIHKNAKNTVGLTPTPKLAEVDDLVKKNAASQQKRSC